MALQFCDGFDSYGALGDVVGKWSAYRYSVPSDLTFVPAGGRFGGGAIRISGTAGMLVRRVAPVVDELFAWMALFPRAYPTSSAPFLWFEDVGGAAASLRMNHHGAVFATWMGSSGTLTPTSPGVFVLNAWNTLAVHFRCADAGGRWRVILNGVEQFNFTGGTRWGGGPLIDRIAIGTARGGAGGEWDYDDFILCDPSGAAMNALITTDVKIETLRPTADEPGGDWTPSSDSARFSLVNGAVPNPANFISASTTGARQLFQLADPAAEPQLTHALVVNMRGRRTDVGPRAIRPLVRVGAGENLASELVLSNQFSTLQHPVYTNPDGRGPWTGAALDGALIGVQLGS